MRSKSIRAAILIVTSLFAVAALVFPKAAYAQLEITTPSALPAATQGVFYSQQLTVTGGTAPYTWVLDTGTTPIPSNMGLQGDGRLLGSPAQSGSFTFTLRVTDGNTAVPLTATKQFSLTVAASFAMTSPLPQATLGLSYSQTLTATGGTPPYAWSVDINTPPLPPGIALSPSPGPGVLSGTPTAAGSFTFTVRVQDAATPTTSATKTLTLTVVSAVGPLEITSPLPLARQGLPYSQTLTLSGGTPPYAWSVVSGAPPAGIALSPSSGVLSGTPTQSASVTFTVMVTDSTTGSPRTATGRFDLTVE